MPFTSLVFQPWNSSLTYSQFDVVYDGVNYFYSTQANNENNSPYAVYVYQLTQFSRTTDIATLVFTPTGAGPSFGVGSMVSTSVTADGTYNYKA